MTQIITCDHVIYTCIYIFAIRSRLREILRIISQLALLFIIDKTQACHWTIYTIKAIMALFMYSTFCRYSIFPVLEYFGTLLGVPQLQKPLAGCTPTHVYSYCYQSDLFSSDRFKLDFCLSRIYGRSGLHW